MHGPILAAAAAVLSFSATTCLIIVSRRVRERKARAELARLERLAQAARDAQSAAKNHRVEAIYVYGERRLP